MGQGAAKAKPGGEKDAQTTTDKDNKTSTKKSDAARNELIAFMREHYNEKVQTATNFDEFYHAIYELIEMFCESRGQLQYRIPSRDELFDQYKKVHKGSGNISEKEFEKIAKGILKVNSFTFGKAAADIVVVLFGLPVFAVLTKRFIPGLKSISDDVVIPAATSGAVVFLTKTNKL